MAEDSDGTRLEFSPTDTNNKNDFMQLSEKRPPRIRGKSSSTYCKRRSLKQHGGDEVTTVMTCEGDINDPNFHHRFEKVMTKLKKILCQEREDKIKVNKIEPWNSVRVTLSIPREAAQRLRQLAAAGDAALQALGILSVQVEGDQVISLRLASRFGGEPQEILLTTGGTSSPQTTVAQALTAAIGGCQAGTSTATFRSPNVVAPGNVGIPPSPKMAPPSGPSPFPFTSMTHAAQAQHSRSESMNNHHNFTPPPPPPPPYPAVNKTTATASIGGMKPPNVRQQPPNTTSPLLVNLLQNEGSGSSSSGSGSSNNTSMPPPPTVRKLSPPSTNDDIKLQPPLDGILNKSRMPPPPLVLQQQSRAIVANSPMVARTPPTPTPINMPQVANVNMIRNRLPSKPSPQFIGKSFQHNQQPIVNTRPGIVPRFPPGVRPTNDVRPVLQGYSQFTAATSKPSTSTNESNDVKIDGINSASDKKLLVNPLTGDLEPMPSESSESEAEDQSAKEDPFLYSPSPGSKIFSDEDSNIMPRQLDGSDHSDTDLSNSLSTARRRNSNVAAKHGQEKIKLRLKLEKCEPVTQSYKVDVSFVNSPAPRKVIPVSGNRAVTTSSSSLTPTTQLPVTTNVTIPASTVLPNNEEPRVPPLHISLRGRNIAVVKPSHWGDEEDVTEPHSPTTLDFHKMNRKKIRTGREEFAIGFNKKTKVKSDGMRLKLPSDELMRVKRKEAKKLKMKTHVSSGGSGEDETLHLKMDSEEFIARTLKEGLGFEKRNNLFNEQSDDERTNKVKLKIKNDFKEVLDTSEMCESVDSSVSKKPQEIGGKIKSELSSKIDRVCGKLKNDLSFKISKDNVCKKLKEEKLGNVRAKVVKKEDHEEIGFAKGRRRHSGDSTVEAQAQKVKNRSSSSDQINTSGVTTVNTVSPVLKTTMQATARRLDSFARRRKDSVIDKLRKDKLKVYAMRKLPPDQQQHAKRPHVNNVINVKQTAIEVQNNNSPVKEIVEEVTKVKEDEPVVQPAGGESPANQGNTQGEDSGIESMDALSEKSPNQGESPCRSERKDEESQKELEEEKKGQNHDRTEDRDEGAKSCLNTTVVEEQVDVTTTTATNNTDTTTTTTTTPQSPVMPSSPDDYPLDKRLSESFEVKIREAFLSDAAQEGLAAKILESTKDECDEVLDRFRVNPPLYTYAKREDSLSPSPVESNDNRLEIKSAEMHDEDSNASCMSGKQQTNKPSRNRRKVEGPSDVDEASNTSSEATANSNRALRGNKSLLEQLLIEIPAEDARRTRSWHRLGNSPGGTTPKSSPRSLKDEPRPSPTGSLKGKRKAALTENEDNHRPNKRKCSENAAELIKACMGLDEKNKVVNNKLNTNSKKPGGEIESSDDEPLIDLAGKTRSREPSVEKPQTNKTTKAKSDDENKNIKTSVVASTPSKIPPSSNPQPTVTPQPVSKASEVVTRRSVRQNNNGTTLKQDVSRSLRSTRNTPITDGDSNKRRRTSRDGK